MTKIVENIFVHIDQCYYDLTSAERKAADFVMLRRGDVQFLSIGEFAEQSGVAEATITRFCRRLGCTGYSAFKLAVAKADGQRRSRAEGQDGSSRELGDRLLDADIQAMRETRELLRPEQLDRAVLLLQKARKVLCMGLGGSMLMAAEAAHQIGRAHV